MVILAILPIPIALETTVDNGHEGATGRGDASDDSDDVKERAAKSARTSSVVLAALSEGSRANASFCA